MPVKSLILLVLLLLFKPTLNAAVITINSTALIVPDPNDGLCILEEAVTATNTNTASGSIAGECVAGDFLPIVDVIEFDNAILPALFLTVEEFTFTESVHIKGPAKELVTFTGIALNRVFTFFNTANDVSFKVTDVTIRDNNNISNEYGAGISTVLFSGASMVIKRVDFFNNSVERGGGALAILTSTNNDNSTLIEDSYFQGNNSNANKNNEVGGGGIFIGGKQNVIIRNSTFADNFVQNFFSNQPLSDAAGGAILMRANGAGFESELLIENSTFTNNSAYGVGGAIAMGGPGYPDDRSIVTIKHSTITNNTSDFNNDQPASDRGGGGVYSSSSTAVNLFNSIAAQNIDNSANPAPELAGVFSSGGFNLIGNNLNASIPFPQGTPNLNNDWVGGAPALIVPQLDALTNNGGPTPTMVPMAASLAIDNGKCNVLTTDQRHHHNPDTGLRTFDDPNMSNASAGCDIGAVERSTVSDNSVPMAVDDSYEILEGFSATIDASEGLLSNDIDDNQLWVIDAGLENINRNSGTEIAVIEIMADGSFNYLPSEIDFYGELDTEYTTSDRLNRDWGKLTLHILPVNDAPSFTAATSPIVANTSELTTTDWAFNIVTGPDNEAQQNYQFLIDTSAVPNGFFNIEPYVDINTMSLPFPKGQLIFELSEIATGDFEISIILVDDGGTENGGIDRTKPITQTIIVSDLIFQDGFEGTAINLGVSQ